jgi:hypothetical protein
MPAALWAELVAGRKSEMEKSDAGTRDLRRATDLRIID